MQSVGGFQTVLKKNGEPLTCTARGRLKRELGEIIVGDLVDYAVEPNGAVIEAVLPRKSVLRRPLVANVDQAVLVFALQQPDPDQFLIDRFLTAIMVTGMPVLLCLNKTDLVSEREAAKWAEPYQKLGFKCIYTSALAHRGRNKLLANLYGRTTVFCGPSGVGKSALLNLLRPQAHLAMGELSKRINRGKHTTRQAKLMPIGRGGFVVDTPGYTQVDLAGLTPGQLVRCFPEIDACEGQCQFRGCMHRSEPGCAVKQALADGRINQSRYEHYRIFQEEINKNQAKSGHRRTR